MKHKTKNLLSLILAALLPFMPLVRSVLQVFQPAGSSTGAIILRWIVGATFLGYDAVSKASSVAISPPAATVGSPYSGTISYSGTFAGDAVSMNINGTCLGSYTVAPGLTVTYTGRGTATVTGTPTGGPGTVGLSVSVYDGSGCSGGEADTRDTSLIIESTGGGPTAPTFLVPPQSTVAQVGSEVILSGGASGNPTPSYFWKLGTNNIPGATQNTLTIPAAALTNAGVYTLVASNSQNQAESACYLTMALTPGSNNLGLFYTNYGRAGLAVSMFSFITNVPSGNNTYSWQYNNGNIGVTTSNLNLAASSTLPGKSGTYSVTFNSTVGSTNIVSSQQYNSYWLFGYLPTITTNPLPETVNAGSNATFSFTLAGGNYPSAFLYQNSTNLMAQTNLPAYNPAVGTGATNLSLTVSNVTAGDAGTYTVVITNYWGSTTSTPVALAVNSPLSVTAPQGETNYAGKNVTLSVTASGASFYGYQWQDGGTNLSDGGSISGSATNTLVIYPATVSNSGTYQVVVTNFAGSSVTSSPALVSILPVPQITALLGAGNVTISATGGIVGSNYIVEFTTNLANSNGWIALQTNAVPGNGSINFTDTNEPNNQDGFYRVQFP